MSVGWRGYKSEGRWDQLFTISPQLESLLSVSSCGLFLSSPLIPWLWWSGEGTQDFVNLFFFFWGDRRRKNHLLGKSNHITTDVSHVQTHINTYTRTHTHKGIGSYAQTQRNSINANAYHYSCSPFCVNTCIYHFNYARVCVSLY